MSGGRGPWKAGGEQGGVPGGLGLSGVGWARGRAKGERGEVLGGLGVSGVGGPGRAGGEWGPGEGWG